MSKNKKYLKRMAAAAEAGSGTVSHNEEYFVIKHDLLRVLLLNVLYLGAVLVLYFTNQKTHYLETWFAKVFHF